MWLNKDRDASVWIPLFFSSYVFVVGLLLMNVVVAVLLDALATSVERERVLLNQHELLANTTKAKMSEGPLDALTSTLSFSSSPLDLEQKLGKLFHRMDLDENLALSYEDFSKGLRHLNFTPALRISRDDFNTVTQGLLNADDKLSYEGFASMMKLEIRTLISRKAPASLHSNQGTITGDMLFLLKMIWSAVEEGAEHKLKQHASTSCGCMARSQEDMIRKPSTRCRDFAFHAFHGWKQFLQQPHTETHKENSNARKLGTGSEERREQQVPSAGMAHGRMHRFSSQHREMGGSEDEGFTVSGCFRRWAREGKLPRPVHFMSAPPAGCDTVRTP
jgi:hypothetical protein